MPPFLFESDLRFTDRSLCVVDESMLSGFISTCCWLFKGQYRIVLFVAAITLIRISTWIHQS